MFKFLLLGIGFYLAWKGLKGLVGNLFGTSDDAKVKPGEKKEPDVTISPDDVVDVNYREVHHDDASGSESDTEAGGRANRDKESGSGS
ncbi:hypothetical protein KQI52_07405 [bacterium]|nr:hypothetical protein [bacterium]